MDAALDVVRRAYPYRDITIEEFTQVLEQLDASRLILYDRDGMTFEKSGRYLRYHFENLSTIPDMLRFKVFDSTNRRIIGTLDQRFVGDHGEQGNIFVLRGSQWRILNVDEKSFAVNVEPLRSGGGGGGSAADPATRTVPYWEGESIPVDYETARRVGLFRGMIRSGRMEVQNKVMGGLTFEVAASGDVDDDDDRKGNGRWQQKQKQKQRQRQQSCRPPRRHTGRVAALARHNSTARVLWQQDKRDALHAALLHALRPHGLQDRLAL